MTPLLLARVGVQTYGAWAVLQAGLAVVLTFDGGIGASVSRFLSANQRSEQREENGRLLASAAVVLVALAGVFDIGTALYGRDLTSLLHTSVTVRRSLAASWPLVMILVTISLLQPIPAGLIASRLRYRELAVTNLVGAIAFIIGVVTLTAGGNRLRGLIGAACIQAGVVFISQIPLALRHFTMPRIGFLGRSQLREFWRYASRTQVMNLASLIANEADTLIIASLLPLRDVAYYSIGSNVALAIRAVPLIALGPAVNSMANLFGRHGREAVVARFARLEVGWYCLVIPYGSTASIFVFGAVRAWLGPGQEATAWVACILTLCYSVNLLTGMLTSFGRAVGTPGPEAIYGVAAVLLNLGLTPALAVFLGLPGVVLATAVGTVVGSALYILLAPRRLDTVRRGPSPLVFLLCLPSLTCGLIGEVGRLGMPSSNGFGLGVEASLFGLSVLLSTPLAYWLYQRLPKPVD